MVPLHVGRLAKLTGVKVTTIRFYESIGLLPEPMQTQSDRRIYGEGDVRRLGFIKHARQLGFAVEAIRDLLELSDHPERVCDSANAIARPPWPGLSP
jgi:DNA-binding transcriptional MerR regulator